MTKLYGDITRSVSASLAKLRADSPDLLKGFNALSEAAMRDGALTRKTKELIALALGVAGHCDACLGFHLKSLIKLGATRAEVEEAIGVAVYMGGGPSLMYAADALAAFEELSAPGPLRQVQA
jgi:AhpD family alkylhydroperoxidase